ncbi:tripartite tricarboxylate transporter substrate binding protein [Diaphorobacter sp. HDW4A]|uniref:Bug family tripartite tricarboxylate transporter substrate binding protein n=1 Tax=Diaphorobacter sp. HDW4A TaxID=2714924 RepID=UPI00140D834E|nr:tripartite tricarboxylate transporter substrate binding protein [Diaphorobacter sp. HDW4A]QIL83228.1 tripartite tricarboxylate transporter substrate binding protein [Diaphorobacter sp. HDW4A]
MNGVSRRSVLRTGAAAAGAVSLGLPQWSMASGKYPDKPVRVIVPFPAGGTTDVVARLILQKLGEAMGQSFIVENKGGANGAIGSEFVARAAPDGYTLLFNTAGAQTLSPVIYKSNYEALASFEPIGLVCDVGFVLIARKDLPANNLQELIALAKKGDKPLSASSGSSMLSLVTEQFKKAINAPSVINAQYKGTSPQMQAVVAGEVDFSFDSFVSVEMIKAGKVKALAVVMPQRAESFPQVPTLKELGIQGMEFGSWAGMLAPKGTPKPIVDELAGQLAKIVKMPDVVAKLKSYDYVPRFENPEEFGKHIQSDTDRWKRIVKETGFKIE